MTLTMTPGRNGHKRPSLSEQIVRLDKMLDGLADGLNEAVAEAVKSAVTIAVQQTVQAVMAEVLTNPAVIEKLHAMAPAKTETATPTIRQRIGGVFGRIRQCLVGIRTSCRVGIRSIRNTAVKGASHLIGFILIGYARVWTLRCFAPQIGMAIGVGAIIGVAAWYSGPIAASALSAVGAAGSTVAVQMGVWLRRIADGIADISQGRLS